MRIKFTLLISIFLLVSCASPTPEPTVTPLPSPTLTATPTSTATPEPTATITSTPDPLARFPEAQSLIDQGMVWDEDKQVVYDEATGLVWGMVGKNGEWYSYTEGNVSIPAGDGSDAPPLEVPIYRSIQDALWGITGELPWDDHSAYKIRPVQRKANELKGSRYWKPAVVKARAENKLGIEVMMPIREILVTTKDGQQAVFRMSTFILEDGTLITALTYASRSTDYYSKTVLVYGDGETIYQALLERSDEIYIPGPDEVRGEGE